MPQEMFCNHLSNKQGEQQPFQILSQVAVQHVLQTLAVSVYKLFKNVTHEIWVNYIKDKENRVHL